MVFFASFSLKAPIQHVPKPRSVAVKIRFCMAIAAFWSVKKIGVNINGKN